MHRFSTLENKYSNIFFYKTIAPTVLKFYMEHDLPPRFQNYKIGSGRISKMAAITKNSKNNKSNFFSRTAGYFWLNFGMEYQWNIGIQNCKNEKKNPRWPPLLKIAKPSKSTFSLEPLDIFGYKFD